MLVCVRIEVKRSRICHVASSVVRHDGDIIADLILLGISFERSKRIAHRHIRRPGNASVGAEGIE